jgi:hypothetical protein
MIFDLASSSQTNWESYFARIEKIGGEWKVWIDKQCWPERFRSCKPQGRQLRGLTLPLIVPLLIPPVTEREGYWSGSGPRRLNSSATTNPASRGETTFDHTVRLALHRSDLDACRYWTEKANREARRYGLSWDCPASLEVADVVKTIV